MLKAITQNALFTRQAVITTLCTNIWTTLKASLATADF